MLFHEIYSLYYRAISRILARAKEKSISLSEMQEITRNEAFIESSLIIPEKLLNGTWPLLDKEQKSILFRNPVKCTTMLERQWLNSISQDERCSLFNADLRTLCNITPLYEQGTFVYHDQCQDGDQYNDKNYQIIFRVLTEAIHKGTHLSIRYVTNRGEELLCSGVPQKLEYSLSDNKFRCIMMCDDNTRVIKLASIVNAEIIPGGGFVVKPMQKKVTKTLEVIIEDRRNALDRFLRQFADLEKETERLRGNLYRSVLQYYAEDEKEIIIRILEFGSHVVVEGPEEIKNEIRTRIKRQVELINE